MLNHILHKHIIHAADSFCEHISSIKRLHIDLSPNQNVDFDDDAGRNYYAALKFIVPQDVFYNMVLVGGKCSCQKIELGYLLKVNIL